MMSLTGSCVEDNRIHQGERRRRYLTVKCRYGICVHLGLET